MKKIGIVGSINTDFVCTTDVLPKIGETVVGKDFMFTFGGKGANEAIACARLKSNVSLFGCLGDDLFSKQNFDNLNKENVYTKNIKQIKNYKCGIANIIVSNKNNQIIVSPGSNKFLNKDYIKLYKNEIKQCSIIGTQFEIQLDAIELLSEIANKNNIIFVLNPSPIKEYSKKIFDNANYVIVNEIELEHVFGYNKKNPNDVLEKYPNKLILTKGKEGCFFFDGKKICHIPSIKANVVDTTGAGDTFMGAFMVGLSNNLPLKDCLIFANICAGLKTEKLGAQTGMPTLEEVKNYLKQNNINLNI